MKVFISHAFDDQGAADKLRKALSSRGLDVFHPSQEIAPGDNWPLKIGRALEDASAMVVLLSPNAAHSLNVQREIEYAISSPRFRGRLIPVMLEKTDDYPWILKKLNVLPFKIDAIAARIRKPEFFAPPVRRQPATKTFSRAV